jgi:predicted methyltransferase
MEWRALASAVLVACATYSPRDLSNATIPEAQPRTPTNVHAVREVEPSPFVATVLAQPDRSTADRALDERKQGADLLTFVGAQPGMRAAELGCGDGYFTELLARAVGPRGIVFAQNSSAVMSAAALDAWQTRLARPAMANVVSYDSMFAHPLPPEARDLDVVYLGVHYGLLTHYGADRDSMNHAVHLALARGGRYVVIDWALPSQAPESAVEAHRQQSRSTRREIESAGFAFEKEGRFLRTSPYPNDWNAIPGVTRQPLPREPQSDVFVLVFVKP